MRVLLISMITASILFATPKALADTNCMAIYGGGQSCVSSSLTVIKNVVNPATNADTHDLGITDPNFTVGQTAVFHITITNMGTNTLSDATVTDIFPDRLTFSSGPGTFDTYKRQLVFHVGNLIPNQSQTFTVTGVILPDKFQTQQDSFCEVNRVEVARNNTNENTVAQDGSQFCILGASSTSTSGNSTTNNSQTSPSIAPAQMLTSPATGPSEVVLGLLGPLGLSGYLLGRYAKKKGARI